MKIIGVKIEGRTGEESDFVIFPIQSVNYITMFSIGRSAEPLPAFHTTGGSYAPIVTLRDLAGALSQFGFTYYDKSTLVNKNRIKGRKRDKGVLIVTFVDNSEIAVAGRSRYR
ncbi:LytTR family transcriptional regulator DNA-binding domain-containing protein [Paenibacillus sp. FSL K6-3166]|uniref:LytTR family transcriptional regulator DNA-binding domain-containing protein n=1 Tax=unclassified Paenibacillus TaxID=185978 RepID=UPI000BA17A1C|nr:LytTR family transcriptional regulator DNA-binding domain-containing protein [Paenibacillus sp. VTT E-133291]OZQ95818.1 hypothetical protein CA598_08285 [Paenibacillus sp. VTT E-133291]